MNYNVESIEERERRELDEAKDHFLEAKRRLDFLGVVIDALQHQDDVTEEDWDKVVAKLDKMQKAYLAAMRDYFELLDKINIKRELEHKPRLRPHIY